LPIFGNDLESAIVDIQANPRPINNWEETKRLIINLIRGRAIKGGYQ
jgi:hypothetical protein